MKYVGAFLALLSAACMNPNDAFFQNHRYKMIQAELGGGGAVFRYGYPKKPDHDLLVNRIRVPAAQQAGVIKEWFVKEQGYRKHDCTLQKAQSNGITYYTCDAEKGFKGVHFVVYVANVKADSVYIKVYRSINKPPTGAELEKLVTDLNQFYP
ncbi:MULTISPECIES: hypothetical protein [unclassified Neisseria]|uniref:hypothetical protein n=1 Tax=unclassified Neisseria TaxID=2623750 RepID=UPI001072DCB1|nr:MULTISPECIES: hypothetical protein [unclassified Neisseria]MBF0803488.1 hypothetical protein [Neisseria sp. 19428wB4_WF04]TFU43876.1 hypothetical protein E4T99_03825 [Neisseria sp. WF04]